MTIHGLTVCVNYSDHLAVGIERLRPGLASWTIVTDLQDEATTRLAYWKHCRVHRTNIFYERGAAFNKGAAMEEARQQMPWEDWILFLDADVVPEEGWTEKLLAAEPVPGNLYGTWRYQCTNVKTLAHQSNRLPHDVPGVGYWQLFHSSDSRVQERPLIETHWLHAGNYDNGFMHRWPRQLRKLLPIKLIHLGDRDNWFGRGRHEEFAAMQAERKRRGGRWDHETIEGVPPRGPSGKDQPCR